MNTLTQIVHSSQLVVDLITDSLYLIVPVQVVRLVVIIGKLIENFLTKETDLVLVIKLFFDYIDEGFNDLKVNIMCK